MTVICLPNCGFLSETSRMVAIYRKLLEIGEPAKIATHGGTYEFVLKAEKIPYNRIDPIQSLEDSRHYLKVIEKPWMNLYDKTTLLNCVKSEVNYFKENKAGAVITGFQLTSTLSARGAGIPLVVSHLGSLVPPIFEKGKFACSECFENFITQFIPDSLLNRICTKLFKSMKFQKKAFNKVANELGIEPIRGMFDLMMGDLTLVTDVPEIFGLSENEVNSWKPSDTKYLRPTARLKYAGAIFAQLFGNIPENVSSFLNTSKPKVYVAMASGRKKNLLRVYDTLSKMDVRTVFCSLVHDNTFPSKENILVTDFLPSHLIMPLCDLAIIHGGQGSVQTAIASGTPLIGFPIQPEQNINLKLVESQGAGVCLSIRSLRKGHLPETIDRILNDKRYKESMMQLKRWQSRRDGALEAAKAVAELIKN